MTDQPTSADFQHAELDWDADGQPRSRQFADVYFANDGGLAEARHAFLLQNDLARRFAELAAGEHLVIGETGFGTGLNALLTLETAEKEKRPVHYTGIELYPLAWPEVDALKYSDNPLFEELHRAAWEEEVAITPYFTLRKVRADVETISIDSLLMINKSPFDVVYFDAFAPEKQPGMWEEKVFRNIHAAMSTDGVLTTYCAKGVVRRMLQAVGFKVERLPGPPGGKREILRGRKEEVING